MKAMRMLRGLALGVVLVSASVAAASMAVASAIPPSGEIPFAVFRNGDSEMGYHRLRFTREGDRVIVEKEINFKVRLAFITAFRYEHRNREVWENGRLVSLDTTTNDDGREHWVRGRATPEGFAVESSRGSLIAPADVIPTSYWNIATIGATKLLDTQRGLMMDVRIEPLGVEPVTADGAAVEARHFRINILSNKPGSTDAIDIWYDDNDAWVKLAFKAKDQQITYRLEEKGLITQQAEAPAGAAKP